MININIDTSQLDKKLIDLKSNVPYALRAGVERSLADIGQAVASRATLAFRSEPIRPSPWAPRKPSKRDDGHPLLIKSGSLRQSIGYKVVGKDTVVVGTDRKYAGYHQFGTKHMPARPFMPLDENGNLLPRMQLKINEIVEKSVAEELGKSGLK